MSVSAEFPDSAVPPNRSLKRVVIVLAVLLTLIVLGGILWWALSASSSDAAEVRTGDCAELGETLHKVDCGSSDVTHIVGTVAGAAANSCAEPYQDYAEEGVNLCLIPDLPEGVCIDVTIESFDVTPVRVDCSDKKAAKVVKVVTGSADKSVCPEGTNPSVYPEPAMTQCIATVQL